MDKNKTFYITTPIYYPNDNLHLGHTYTTIVADTLKRFKEIDGYDVFFVTGTDEHGQKLQLAAEKAGKKPLEYIDPIVKSAKKLWEKLGINYDVFIRSTDERHQKNVSDIFQKLYDKGEIYKAKYKGNYCIPCEAFWTDAQLLDGKCPDCGRDVSYHEEESYFFKLSKYRDRLLKLYEENDKFILPKSRQNEMINNFLKDGLEDLSVSRTSFDWGVKVPFDQKHVIYVWIDALSCYLTGIGYGYDEEKFNKYWPANVHLVGKEIMRFHTIIWPALLMALELPLPKTVFGHGWILFDDDKMSKSKGNIVYAEPIIETYGVDALKYFILREFNFGSDGSFTYERFLNRINSDLANDLGNLVSRTLAMAEKYFDGIVPEPGKEEKVDLELKEMATSISEKIEKSMDKFDISIAVEEIWKFISRNNKYIDETMPWKLINEDKERLKTVIYNLCESLRIISTLISFFMVETSKKINEQLGVESSKFKDTKIFGLLKAGTKVKKGNNLFQRLDVKKEIEKISELNAKLIEERSKSKSKSDSEEIKNYIDIEDFEKLDLKVGKIISCKEHPKADKLYVLKVKIGNDERQIVSGIKQWYTSEEIVGKNVVVITNLKPIKLRGLESNGMILASTTEDGKDLSLITTMSEIEDGSGVS